MEAALPYLVFIVLIMVFLAKAFIPVKENQRIILLRFGKYESTLGPGLVFIIPFADMPIVVNLTKHVPKWQAMTSEEINEIVKTLVLNDPDPKKYK
jgi:regulator of protease activity HflC (stomatin/prohibitin superfamily)